MGEIIPVHNGMRVCNVQKYFLDDWTYVEEFDTEDGTHWRAECTPDEYPQEVIDILAKVGVKQAEKPVMVRFDGRQVQRHLDKT